MGQIMLITGNFPLYDKHGIPTGKGEFVVSHGINMDTGRDVIIENVHPNTIPGAYYDGDIGEWMIRGE
jgi:hypothetical protein